MAYHDDLADPQSKDPVDRESTRLWCAAGSGAQTTLDPRQMREWFPNAGYGGHALGKDNFAQFLADRESLLPRIAEPLPERRKAIAISCLGLPLPGNKAHFANFSGHIDEWHVNLPNTFRHFTFEFVAWFSKKGIVFGSPLS